MTEGKWEQIVLQGGERENEDIVNLQRKTTTELYYNTFQIQIGDTEYRK